MIEHSGHCSFNNFVATTPKFGNRMKYTKKESYNISFFHFSITVSLISLYRLIFSLFHSDTYLFSLSLQYHYPITGNLMENMYFVYI